MKRGVAPQVSVMGGSLWWQILAISLSTVLSIEIYNVGWHYLQSWDPTTPLPIRAIHCFTENCITVQALKIKELFYIYYTDVSPINVKFSLTPQTVVIPITSPTAVICPPTHPLLQDVICNPASCSIQCMEAPYSIDVVTSPLENALHSLPTHSFSECPKDHLAVGLRCSTATCRNRKALLCRVPLLLNMSYLISSSSTCGNFCLKEFNSCNTLKGKRTLLGGAHNANSYSLTGCMGWDSTQCMRAYNNQAIASIVNQLEQGIRAFDFDFCGSRDGKVRSRSCHYDSGTPDYYFKDIFKELYKWISSRAHCELFLIRLSNVDNERTATIVYQELNESGLLSLGSLANGEETVSEVLTNGRPIIFIFTKDNSFSSLNNLAVRTVVTKDGSIKAEYYSPTFDQLWRQNVENAIGGRVNPSDPDVVQQYTGGAKVYDAVQDKWNDEKPLPEEKAMFSEGDKHTVSNFSPEFYPRNFYKKEIWTWAEYSIEASDIEELRQKFLVEQHASKGLYYVSGTEELLFGPNYDEYNHPLTIRNDQQFIDIAWFVSISFPGIKYAGLVINDYGFALGTLIRAANWWDITEYYTGLTDISEKEKRESTVKTLTVPSYSALMSDVVLSRNAAILRVSKRIQKWTAREKGRCGVFFEKTDYAGKIELLCDGYYRNVVTDYVDEWTDQQGFLGESGSFFLPEGLRIEVFEKVDYSGAKWCVQGPIWIAQVPWGVTHFESIVVTKDSSYSCSV